jgi:hypothetical protein
MWSCEGCTKAKTDNWPGEETIAAGYRFFKADEDIYVDHFERNHVELKGKTSVGRATVAFVNLNRPSLRELRRIREKKSQTEKEITAGIQALFDFPIDQLPPSIRSKVERAALSFAEAMEECSVRLMEALREYAKSTLIIDDDEQDWKAENKAQRDEIQALFPDEPWRAPRKSTRKSGRKNKKRR